jgi:tRNA U34 5-carboxymethylaminomethyl modifying GTPase MnmE/TrmE
MSFIFNQLHQIVEDTTPLLNTYLPDMAHQIFQSSKQKVNERTLRIQLYGTYNAGKSTLVNVLLGKNEAVVGEIPTTDKVDEFNWNGYKLLDSPGVNAPIEHEEIVTAQPLVKIREFKHIIRHEKPR